MRGSGYSNLTVRASARSSPLGFRAEYASLEEVVEQFLAKVGGPVQRACLAVAGPVSEGRVVATNLAWIVDTGSLARVVGLDTVRLINDLEAIAPVSGTWETPTWLCSTRDAQAAKGTGRSSPPAQVWERPVPTGTGAATTRSHARAGTPTSGLGRVSRWGTPELSAPQARSREF